MLNFIIVKICPSATFMRLEKSFSIGEQYKNSYRLKLVTSLFNINYVILILEN
jgi:hypothetical protein